MTRLREHLAYHVWASRRALEAARDLTPEEYSRNLGSSHGGAGATLAHIYQADHIWLERLGGASPSALAPAPETLEGLEREWFALLDRWTAFGESLSEADHDRPISYRTIAGSPYTNTIEQIVTHVVNHGTYHRGQVAALLRQLGHKPPRTDLIDFYRGR